MQSAEVDHRHKAESAELWVRLTIVGDFIASLAPLGPIARYIVHALHTAANALCRRIGEA
jgi:hypothetical protein